jgi:hypothetical protein
MQSPFYFHIHYFDTRLAGMKKQGPKKVMNPFKNVTDCLFAEEYEISRIIESFGKNQVADGRHLVKRI